MDILDQTFPAVTLTAFYDPCLDDELSEIKPDMTGARSTGNPAKPDLPIQKSAERLPRIGEQVCPWRPPRKHHQFA